MEEEQLIPHLFRTESSKIAAVLCKTFGLSNIQLAEDITSDTFLTATETWRLKGIPDNPTAWLYAVAKNKAKDQLKRKQLFDNKIQSDIMRSQEDAETFDLDLSDQNITDSQLQMLFAICQPMLPQEAQVGLALRILCGFGIEEIAQAFLTNKETINKRLFRAKEKLRKEQVQLAFPNESALNERLDSVISILYLLFNEGYYSSIAEQPIRKDLCLEAMRLTHLLVNHPLTNISRVNALLALMCFQASRFEARVGPDQQQVLYDDQDKTLWNKELIDKGAFYLNKSIKNGTISKYQLEASISYLHTQQVDNKNKWEQILQLYNRLLRIEYSPIAALNRTYALAKANGKKEAIEAAKKINLSKHHLYHLLLAELYNEIDEKLEKDHLLIALKLSKSKSEKDFILNKLKKRFG